MLETLSDDLWNMSDVARAEAKKLVKVVDLGSGGWEWDQFVGYRHTETGRFYWISGSGCSCNGLFDDVSCPSNLEDGTAKDLAESYKSWAKGSYSETFSDTMYTTLKVGKL